MLEALSSRQCDVARKYVWSFQLPDNHQDAAFDCHRHRHGNHRTAGTTGARTVNERTIGQCRLEYWCCTSAIFVKFDSLRSSDCSGRHKQQRDSDIHGDSDRGFFDHGDWNPTAQQTNCNTGYQPGPQFSAGDDSNHAGLFNDIRSQLLDGRVARCC